MSVSEPCKFPTFPPAPPFFLQKALLSPPECGGTPPPLNAPDFLFYFFALFAKHQNPLPASCFSLFFLKLYFKKQEKVRKLSFSFACFRDTPLNKGLNKTRFLFARFCFSKSQISLLGSEASLSLAFANLLLPLGRAKTAKRRPGGEL